MLETLLRTKLFVAPRRPNLVPRSQLIDHLNQGLQHNHKLTLVSAPAGFGKTTLLAEWIASCEQPAAWLSLDDGDNDRTRFLTYFVAALQTVAPETGRMALSMLQSPQPPPTEAIMTVLVNEITSIADDFLFVLDDYHVIDGKPAGAPADIDRILTFLLAHKPPQMHLAIATREDPNLPLARLRARGQLTELRATELRFSSSEAAKFLNQVMGLKLSTEDIAALERRTEGWIAGLQMAAISMRGSKDRSAFAEVFSGSHHFILDYLVEEVLDQQRAGVREFMLKTAVLKRMTASLCDAVTGGTDGQTKLTQLEQANLFLVPLDDERRWYRTHHLFADLLKNILRQRMPAEEIRELHRRASRWHQREGFLEEAMIHAMAAQDFEQAALMIEENITSMFSRNEVPVLLGWIDKLPREIVDGRPWIDVHRATTLALASQLDEVDPLLEGLEKRIGPETPQRSELLGHIAAIRAYMANLRGDAARVIEMAALTKRYLPQAYPAARGMAAYALADTYFAGDELNSASQALQDMFRAGQKTGQLLLIVPALCDLASLKKAQGRLHQAKELYDRAQQQLIARKGLESRVRCAYEFGLADLLREWNQLDEAQEHVELGMAYRQRLGGYLVTGDMALMRVLQARGDSAGAMEALRNAERHMRTYHFQLAVTLEFKTAWVTQCLAAGDVQMACRWAEEGGGGSELEQMALARLRLAQGDAAGAQHLLARQRELAEAGGRNGRLIEILGLLAMALKALGQSGEAAVTLTQALFLARPERYRRVFLDMGRPMHDLLEQQARRSATAEGPYIAQEYVRDLLGAFEQQNLAKASLPSSATGELIVPLTEREQTVLQLLAEGLTNKQIADRLVVAPSTVKEHLKNIYRKLDVHSRTQAVARGRELNLL